MSRLRESKPAEAAIMESAQASQALFLLTVLSLLEESQDLEEAKSRLNTVIKALTYTQRG